MGERGDNEHRARHRASAELSECALTLRTGMLAKSKSKRGLQKEKALDSSESFRTRKGERERRESGTHVHKFGFLTETDISDTPPR
jgi:hypothetical protein